jgi:Arc/MetJ-type ribon-helix-helix transcriptional regulator
MNINLTPEQEIIVNSEVKSGRFRTPEEVITQALVSLREKEQTSTEAVGNGDSERAVREMQEFIEKNRVRLQDITVKQLIHEGHRW